MAGASLIGNLAVTLGLNTAAFEAGASKAEGRAKTLQGRLAGIGNSMKGFAGGLIAGVGVSAITGLVGNAFELASALDESAQKMGVSVEALQELNLAAEQSGVSQEALSGAIGKMNKSIGALAQGAKPAVDAFAKLGLTYDDLKGKSPDQQLRIIADKLNALPSLQEKVKVGSDIMGRGFSELLPLINGGSQALNDYADKSKKQGQITSDEAKQLDALSDSWENFKVKLGVAIAKVIANVSSALVSWEKWRDGVAKAANDMLGSWERLRDNGIQAIQQLVEGVANSLRNGLGKVIDWAKGKIQEVGDKFKWLWDVTVGHSYIPDMVQGIASEFARLQKIMVDPALSASEKVGAAFQGLANIASQVFGRKTGGILSSILGAIGTIAPLFGGAKIAGPNLGGTQPVSIAGTSIPSRAPVNWGPLPRFAKGGAGTFGGFGGVDRNVLSLNGSPIARVSRGEHFSVTRKDSGIRVQVVKGDLFDVIVDRRASNVAAPMAGQAAVLGAGAAEQRSFRRANQQIP